MKYSFILFFAISLAISACGPSSSSNNEVDKDNPLLKEAAAIHNESIKVEAELKPQIEALKQVQNQLNVQGRELTEEELNLSTKVDGLMNSLSFLEENHIEVPGFGHDDHEGHDHSGHDHDHDHDHSAPLDLSPEEMLAVQKEFRDSVMSLKARVETINQLVNTIQEGSSSGEE